MIKKKITLSWQGEDHKIDITMALIHEIEEDVNLLKLIKRCSTGDIPFSHASLVIAKMLQSVGVEVTSEEIFQGVFAGEIDGKQVGAVLAQTFAAFFPETKKKPVKRKPARKKLPAKKK